jgi:hypothetical protein
MAKDKYQTCRKQLDRTQAEYSKFKDEAEARQAGLSAEISVL